jgi:DNA invertase Pin-like site-specific DNA recombinase
MIPVIELLRVSTESQAHEDRAGLPAQHATNVRTASQYGLQIVEAVEIVESGADVARSPEMGRVLDSISAGRVRGIVLAEYSRLFRPDRWSDLAVLQTISDHGAQIYLPAGPIDLQSELGFVQATVNNLLVAMERRRIRERMLRGKEEHRRRGGYMAGGLKPPFGVSYSKKEGWQYTADAEIVKDLFRRFVGGERNVAALKRELGFRSRNGVLSVLKNPIYTGWRVYDERRDQSPVGRYDGGERRKVKRAPDEVIRVQVLEPIVSEADFALVQELLSDTTARPRPGRHEDHFTYRGFLCCGAEGCGRSVYTSRWQDKRYNRWQAYYLCQTRIRSRRHGRNPCSSGYMNRDQLEGVLDRAVATRLTDAGLLVDAISAYTRSLEAGWRSAEPDQEAVRSKVDQLQSRRERILESYIDGHISREDRDRRLVPIAQEIAAAERLLLAVPVPLPDALSAELIAALITTFAEWQFLERRDKRSILAGLAPTFYVDRYTVAGVRFPVATLTGRAVNTARHSGKEAAPGDGSRGRGVPGGC